MVKHNYNVLLQITYICDYIVIFGTVLCMQKLSKIYIIMQCGKVLYCLVLEFRASESVKLAVLQPRKLTVFACAGNYGLLFYA